MGRLSPIKQPMKFSIIIPTLNSAKYLEPCLNAIEVNPLKPSEIIIIDGGSTDDTLRIAKDHRTKIIHQTKSYGRSRARDLGITKARSDILVFLDSDNLVAKHTLQRLLNSFTKNPTAEAIVGLVSKSHPNSNFASIYKNLYMHHKLSLLPKQITFLQGDIYAVKKPSIPSINQLSVITDDTLRGHLMVEQGKTIILDKKIRVKHLKKYNFFSLLKNDFIIPYNWAIIFWQNSGWKQLTRTSGGFAHASPSQLLSLFIAPTISLTILTSLNLLISFSLLTTWLTLNLNFFNFLYQEKGGSFALKSVLFTYLDHHIMAAGTAAGTIASLSKPRHV